MIDCGICALLFIQITIYQDLWHLNEQF